MHIKSWNICEACGKPYVFNRRVGETRLRCSSCIIGKRIRALKEQAVKYKGGCCQSCGYDKYIGALDFHHLDAMQKSFNISGKSISWKRLKEELDKCVLLCANCHREQNAVVTIKASGRVF